MLDHERLRQLRQARREEHGGWTQEWIAAEQLKISVKTYRNWENGHTQPSRDLLDMLCELFEVERSELWRPAPAGGHTNGALGATARRIEESDRVEPLDPAALDLATVFDRAQALADQAKAQGHRYKLGVMQWRVQRGLRKFDEILSGRWSVHALDKYDYLRQVFGAVLDLLQPEDVYCTLSCLDFWEKGRYLTDNFVQHNVAAVERGARIDRIVVVDERWFEDPQTVASDRARAQLRALVPRLERIVQAAKGRGTCTASFLVSDNYRNAYQPYVPYAFVSNTLNGDALVVRPLGPELRFSFTRLLQEDFERERRRFEAARSSGGQWDLARMRAALGM